MENHNYLVIEEASKVSYALGIMLKNLGKLDEAEISYRQAITLNPNFNQAKYKLGTLLLSNNKNKEAIEQFLAIGDFQNSKLLLLRCFFNLNMKQEFLNLLQEFINKNVVHPIIGSLVSRFNLKHQENQKNLFCSKPLDFVSKTNLKTLCDFEEVFVKPSKHILSINKVPQKSYDLLTNGYQTEGNVFELDSEPIKKIEKFIHEQIIKYQNNFGGSKEGLIQNCPDRYTLYGWLICMKSGGELRPHMHENGWLSGTVYINVPTKPKLNPESGNLVVCIEEKIKEQIVDVVTGTMCIFPASLLHYTIPFKSTENRIVLAFDVVPKL